MAKNKNDYVWYASYGSNLLESRFHCYIKGGIPEGASKIQKGCIDKTLPIQNKAIKIYYPLYFAKYSTSWGGAVAFIDDSLKSKQPCLGRMYLISRQQFEEVVRQENNDLKNLNINYNLLNKQGFLLLSNKLWYGKLLHLGEDSTYPIYSFTNNSKDDIAQPSDPYLKTIVKGMLELKQDISLNELYQYLNSELNTKNSITKERIKNLL